MVVRRGLNETSVVPMARWARNEGLILRFIEYMDVGHTNGWRMDDVVPAAEILGAIGEAMPLEPVPPSYPGEVADRYRYLDGTGEVGVIASVTGRSAARCTRARLSADGKLYTCLFGTEGHDLRELLRSGCVGRRSARRPSAAIWTVRADRYSELRSEATESLPRAEMFALGG